MRLNELGGNTEQKQYSGTNLFGGIEFANALVESGAATINTSNKTVLLTASLADAFYWQADFKENTQYSIFFRGYNTNVDTDSEYVTRTNIAIVYTDSTKENLEFSRNFTDRSTILKITAKGKTVKGLSGSYNAGISLFYYEDFGIFEGVLSMEDFEPYVGAVASPNPDYPQEINNVGDCVEMIQGYYNVGVNGSYVNSTNFICNKYSIPCKTSDVIKFEFNDVLYCRVLYFNEDTYVTTSVYQKNNPTFTVPTGVDNFTFYIYPDGTTQITPETVGKIQLTINDKYVTQIVQHGKNLIPYPYYGYNGSFTSNGITATITDDGAIKVNGTCTAAMGIGLVRGDMKLQGFYYLSGINSPTSGIYLQPFIDGVAYGSLRNGVQRYEMNGTLTKLAIFVSEGTTVSNLIIKPLLRKEGISDDTYEIYKEHVATIYTDEPLRKGDVLQKVDGVWQIERSKANFVFNGNNSSYIQYLETINGFGKVALDLPSGKVMNTFGDVISNNLVLKNLSGSSMWSNPTQEAIFINGSNSSGRLLATIKNINSLEDFKTWGELNKPEFEYVLVNPKYEILDTESQLALNSLETFEDVTYIDIDSRVQPESVEYEYGTSQVGAYTLKALNNSESSLLIENDNKAQIEALKVALVAIGSEV